MWSSSARVVSRLNDQISCELKKKQSQLGVISKISVVLTIDGIIPLSS